MVRTRSGKSTDTCLDTSMTSEIADKDVLASSGSTESPDTPDTHVKRDLCNSCADEKVESEPVNCMLCFEECMQSHLVELCVNSHKVCKQCLYNLCADVSYTKDACPYCRERLIHGTRGVRVKNIVKSFYTTLKDTLSTILTVWTEAHAKKYSIGNVAILAMRNFAQNHTECSSLCTETLDMLQLTHLRLQNTDWSRFEIHVIMEEDVFVICGNPELYIDKLRVFCKEVDMLFAITKHILLSSGALYRDPVIVPNIKYIKNLSKQLLSNVKALYKKHVNNLTMDETKSSDDTLTMDEIVNPLEIVLNNLCTFVAMEHQLCKKNDFYNKKYHSKTEFPFYVYSIFDVCMS